MGLIKKHRTLLFVMVLAAIFRLYGPGLNDTWIDELTLINSATELAHNGHMQWVGNRTTSSLIPVHSPLSIYVTALPLFVTPNPIASRILFALIGVLTVALLYLMVERYFGKEAAIFAGIMVSIAPLPVYWARFVWNPNLAPVFVVAWLWTGLSGYHEKKLHAQILHWVFLSLMIQSQTALVVMSPLSVWLALRYFWLEKDERLQTIKGVVIGAALSIMLALPWITGLVGIRMGWWSAPTGSLLRYDDSLPITLPSLRVVLEYFNLILSSYDFGFNRRFVAFDYHPFNNFIDLRYVIYAQTTVILSAVLVVIVKFWRDRFRFPEVFVACVLFLPLIIVVAFIAVRTVPNYYLQGTVFATMILFGITSAQLVKWHKILIIIPLLFITTQAYFSIWMLNYYQSESEILLISRVQNLLRVWSNNGNNEVVILEPPSEELSRVRTEWLLMWHILDEQFPLRVVQNTHALPFAPEGQTIVTLAHDESLSQFSSTIEQSSTARREFQSMFITPDDLPVPEFRSVGANRVGDIMTIYGISAGTPRPAEPLHLSVLWQVGSPDDLQYQFSIRLMDENGNGYGQVDGEALQRNLWRSGDLVLSQFTMNVVDFLPEGIRPQYHVRVYSLPALQNFPVIDETGAVTGDAVILQSDG